MYGLFFLSRVLLGRTVVFCHWTKNLENLEKSKKRKKPKTFLFKKPRFFPALGKTRMVWLPDGVNV